MGEEAISRMLFPDYSEYDYDSGGLVNFFFKCESIQTVEQFADLVKKKCQMEIEEQGYSQENFDAICKILWLDEENLIFIFPAGNSGLITDTISNAAKETPIQALLLTAIWNEITDDNTVGFQYELYRNSQKEDNDLQLYAVDDFENDYDVTIQHRNDVLDEALIPVFEKWDALKDNSDGDDDVGKDLDKAKAFEKQGMEYLQSSDFAQALECFTQAIKWCPEDAPRYDRAYLFCLSGHSYNELGQFDKALSDISKAIELAPKSADYLNTRAYIYKELGQLDKAIVDVNKALELEPDSIMFWSSRAEMYEAQGEYQKAINDCNKTMELNPPADSDEYIEVKKILALCEAALKNAKPAPTDKAPAQQSGRTCSACGHALRPTAKFCPSCGVKQAVVCANCGAEPKKAEAKFCHKCGNKL